MAITANSLQGFLAVYAQESLKQFVAAMPSMNLFTRNFSTDIANGGVSVTTRIISNSWATASNDLATDGWASSVASASSVTATLKERNRDLIFNELEWATITPSVLQNLYFPNLVKQLANDVTTDVISNVTSSYFTNTVTCNSSSLFTVTGSSSSLQACATKLSNLESPEDGRYAIVTPNVYETLAAGILPTYIYGNDGVVQGYKAQRLLNFELSKYARLYNATLPNGGTKYAGGDKLVGFAGTAEGMVVAMRSPIDMNNGLVQSAIATDETSGISIQTRMVYDVSKPAWRIAAVAVWGAAKGNASAIVPIITASV